MKSIMMIGLVLILFISGCTGPELAGASAETYLLVMNRADSAKFFEVSIDGKKMFSATLCAEDTSCEGSVRSGKYLKIKSGSNLEAKELSSGLKKSITVLEDIESIDIMYDGNFSFIFGMKQFQDNYRLCDSGKEKVLVKTFCGDDSCWSSYYNSEGLLVEETPEYGPGAGDYEIRTVTKNCMPVSEDEFLTEIKDPTTIREHLKRLDVFDCGIDIDRASPEVRSCFFNAYKECRSAKMEIKGTSLEGYSLYENLAIIKYDCSVIQYKEIGNMTGVSVCEDMGLKQDGDYALLGCEGKLTSVR
ncbi:hypothetical protein ACFL0V_00595 [Nanoarchaeota archaeon]